MQPVHDVRSMGTVVITYGPDGFHISIDGVALSPEAVAQMVVALIGAYAKGAAHGRK